MLPDDDHSPPSEPMDAQQRTAGDQTESGAEARTGRVKERQTEAREGALAKQANEKLLLLPLVVMIAAYAAPYGCAKSEHLFSESEVRARVLNGTPCRRSCEALEASAVARSAYHRSELEDAGAGEVGYPVGLDAGTATWMRTPGKCGTTGNNALDVCCGQCVVQTARAKALALPLSEMDLFCTSGGTLREKSSLHFISFFPGVASIAWPLMLAALALLAVRGADLARLRATHLHRWFGWTVLFGLLVLPVNLARESALRFEDGRRIFSHTNIDLSRSSMYVMLCEFGAFCALLAVIWVRRHSGFRRSPDKFRVRGSSSVSADSAEPREAIRWRRAVQDALDADRASDVSDQCEAWIGTSLLVSAAFLPGTFCYWRLVGVMKDYRYLPPALTTHALWIATAYVVTRPVAHALWEQHRRRIRAFSELALVRVESFEREKELKLEELRFALEQMQPVVSLGLVFGLIASIVSQVIPLLQLFK